MTTTHNVSQKTNRILLVLFRIEIRLAIISAVLYVLYPLSSGTLRFTIIGNLISFVGLVWLLSTLCILVIFPIWLYKLQCDLAFRFSGYPIKPWHTILWYFIPWYSVWGVMKFSKTLTDYLLSEEDEKFNRQSYFAVDPRYHSWVYVYIFFFYNKEFKRYKQIPLGFQLLRIFAIFYPIWFFIAQLSALGFGNVLNLFAPTFSLLLYSILFQLPIYGWMSSFPSFTDTLLKAGFLLFFLTLLIQFVRVSQQVVTD